MGRRFINQVMEEVLTKFQPGVLPHCFVVLTFANLSVANGRFCPLLLFAQGEDLQPDGWGGGQGDQC